MLTLTSLDFLTPGKPWPPPSEQERLNLYEENRKLFEGKHGQVFRDWIRLLRDDQKATLELVLNWHKRLSTLWADLLLGEPPKITAGNADSPEQAEIERIVADNHLVSTAYEVAIDVSRFGTGLFKVRLDGQGIIEGQPPAVWFPVVASDNVKRVTAHVLAWTYEEGSPGLFGEKKTKYLKLEIHEKGQITNRLHLVKNGKISTLQEEETVTQTGVDDFLVVPVNNLLTTDRVTGLDDYSDLDSIIQEMEIRVGQVSRILDKHSDPNMYGPESALEIDPATGKTTYRAGGKYFPLGDGDQPPGYVTWDGQLDSSFQEFEVLLDQLYTLSETSAAAFGNIKEGRAESGTALRRLMMAPLAKVNRIRMRFDPALKKALQLASALEVAQRVSDAVRLENISIAWQDGLPQDEKEQTDIMTERVQAGTISRETALRRLDGLDDQALQDELVRIKADSPAPVASPEGPRVELPATGTPGETGGGS